MEALLIAVLGLMLAALPLAGGERRPVSEESPVRFPHRPSPDPSREKQREAVLHRRRIEWLDRDLALAVRDGDAAGARRLRALVKAEEARHAVRMERLDRPAD